jgi:TRIAD3 protein (E3 ubiquitin-protein ligase RNF216)
MCYICKLTIKGYDHFCQHPRNPGQGCRSCKKCSLWTSSEDDDARAVKEAKEEALKEAHKENPAVQVSRDYHILDARTQT